MKKTIIALLLSAAILNTAEAACSRADQTGTWIVFSTVNGDVARCTVVFPSTGTAMTTTSSCYVPSVGTYTLRGNLTLTSNCHLYGSINVGGMVNSMDGWISKGKDSISGIVWQPSHPENGALINGSKI